MQRPSLSAWVERLYRPVDAAWLAALRSMFGAVMFVSMLRFLAYGWVERFFVTPRFHFKYWGFDWVAPLPQPAMFLLFIVLAVLSLMLALGCLFRFSAVTFALGLSYVQLIDVSNYLNHYYLASLLALLLACSPAQRCWSVDALRQRKRGAPLPPHLPQGWLFLFRFQVGVVYLFAGLAKLQSDWLLHAQPLRIWLGTQVSLPLIGPLLSLPELPWLLSWAGFVFDTTIVLWLMLPKTRPYAYAVVIVFHVITRVLFPIGMFPAIMTSAAIVFFSPSWPRRLAARLRLRSAALAVQPRATASNALAARHRGRQLGLAIGAAYCVLQLALPMRAWAYGGNVLWHEQGMRFSWRVKLRAKGGSTTFIARHRDSGRTFHVSPRLYLTDLQESEMSSQPDLILQLAHHIARDLERRGLGSHAIYVDARVSLNGRRSQALIDPHIDLTQVHDGLERARWIMPAPQGAPAHTRVVL